MALLAQPIVQGVHKIPHPLLTFEQNKCIDELLGMFIRPKEVIFCAS